MTAAVTIRVDRDLKAEVEELFDDLGLNMTTAITCFFKKCVKTQSIPFILSKSTLSLEDEFHLLLNRDSKAGNSSAKSKKPKKI